jgi:hypothetical protein
LKPENRPAPKPIKNVPIKNKTTDNIGEAKITQVKATRPTTTPKYIRLLGSIPLFNLCAAIPRPKRAPTAQATVNNVVSLTFNFSTCPP